MGIDAPEPDQTAAAKEPREHGLRLIVLCMPDRDRHGPARPGEAEERFVTSSSGGVLKARALDRHGERDEGEAEPAGEAADTLDLRA
jgi:hypothetical protein